MLCGCDQVPLHMCTHSMGSLLWVHPQHIPWGRGRGTPYTHNLTTHHTSPPTNCPHHTHTTLPHWPHLPNDHTHHWPHLPTFHAPLTLPPTHWWVVASGLSSKKDGSAHFLGSVMTRSCIWCVSHAWMTQLLCTRTWLQRLAITGEEVLLCYLAREHYLHGKQPIL